MKEGTVCTRVRNKDKKSKTIRYRRYATKENVKIGPYEYAEVEKIKYFDIIINKQLELAIRSQ